MAIAFVAERQQLSESVSSATHVFAPDATIAAGRFGIICFASSGAPTISSVVDSQGNAWQADKVQSNAGNVTVVIASGLIVTQLTTSDTITLTTSTTPAGAGVLWEFSGVATTAPADQSAGNATSSTSMDSGATSTLSQADELVIGAFGVTSNNKAFTKGATYSQPSVGEIIVSAGSFQRQCAPEYKIVSATTAVSADGTIDGSAVNWAAAVVTYEAAAEVVPVGNRLRRWLT